ncbi:MAG: hypothetical protein JXD22_06140 [Sedimentisphaerales bacterium]|nr:hypothetical protein [Sedimentisphaerales bacterium]
MMPRTIQNQHLPFRFLFWASKLILFTLFLTNLLPSLARASGTYSGGNGEPNTPFQIADADDLIEMSQHDEDWDKNFILTGDPNLIGHSFTTALIAPDTDRSTIYFQGTPFTGSFDGQNHTIGNLTIDTAGADNDFLGLFGYLESDATIYNLGLENIQITGGTDSDYLGGLVALNGFWSFSVGGTITNCYATGIVTGGESSQCLGCLVGSNDYGTISNCYATGSVTGGNDSSYLGGLAGFNSSHITNSYATGSVTGGDYSDYLGGLTGQSGRDSIVSNCYATGSVTGGNSSRYLGGLAGSGYSTISNCYATGTVTGDSYLGGLVGYNYKYSLIISNCYATGSVNGNDYLGGLVGYAGMSAINNNCYFLDTAGPDNGYGEPLDDPNMQVQSSFVGWDFVDSGPEEIWRMGFMAPGYPILYYQHDIPGDFTGSYGVDLLDYAYLSNFWADTNCTPTNNKCSGADLDLSGDVTLPDLMIMLGHWLDGK